MSGQNGRPRCLREDPTKKWTRPPILRAVARDRRGPLEPHHREGATPGNSRPDLGRQKSNPIGCFDVSVPGTKPTKSRKTWPRPASCVRQESTDRAISMDGVRPVT